MPISAPSQIGLDILRSPALPGIEPARAERLGRSSAAAGQFEVGETGGAKAADTTDKPDTPASFKRFEAMVLQTFIQNMLPKDSASVYGKGMAGDMWKSMMAGKIADVMTERGGIGIASHLLADHYIEGKTAKPIGPVSRGPERIEEDRQAALSAALVQELQRKAANTLRDTGSDAVESPKPYRSVS